MADAASPRPHSSPAVPPDNSLARAQAATLLALPESERRQKLTRLRLTFSEYSSIGVGSGGMTRISYSYEPQLVATQG